MRKELRCSSNLFPMPVILVATYNEDGSVDVMTAAWGCAYDAKEVYIDISANHMTFKNIQRTNSFTIALADEKHVKEADYVGIISANASKDKFQKSGLTASKGLQVNAPVLEDFGVIMECTAVEINPGRGIIGEVKRLAVRDEYIDKDGKVNVTKLGVIAFDPFNNGYYVVNKKVGQAFSDGMKLKK